MQKLKINEDNIFSNIDKVLRLIETNKDNEISTESPEKLLNKKRANDFIEENKERIKNLQKEREEKVLKAKDGLRKSVDNKILLGQRLANEGILKSKGLFRKRKKYQGNAKLHLREKFHKKEKLRKNFIKEYEGKPEVYGGEVTGIRRDLIRSTKFK